MPVTFCYFLYQGHFLCGELPTIRAWFCFRNKLSSRAFRSTHPQWSPRWITVCGEWNPAIQQFSGSQYPFINTCMSTLRTGSWRSFKYSQVIVFDKCLSHFWILKQEAKFELTDYLKATNRSSCSTFSKGIIKK